MARRRQSIEALVQYLQEALGRPLNDRECVCMIRNCMSKASNEWVKRHNAKHKAVLVDLVATMRRLLALLDQPMELGQPDYMIERIAARHYVESLRSEASDMGVSLGKGAQSTHK